VGKPERKRPLARQRYISLVDNIKMDVGGVGWDSMNWIDPAYDRNQ
jgi:hypothetical protein